MQDVMTQKNIAENWPISRNHDEALDKFHLNSVEERQGYINLPIFDFISYDNIVADSYDNIFALIFTDNR